MVTSSFILTNCLSINISLAGVFWQNMESFKCPDLSRFNFKSPWKRKIIQIIIELRRQEDS